MMRWIIGSFFGQSQSCRANRLLVLVFLLMSMMTIMSMIMMMMKMMMMMIMMVVMMMLDLTRRDDPQSEATILLSLALLGIFANLLLMLLIIIRGKFSRWHHS